MTFKQCEVEIEIASHMSHKIRGEKNERENWLIVCHLGLDRYLALANAKSEMKIILKCKIELEKRKERLHNVAKVHF